MLTNPIMELNMKFYAVLHNLTANTAKQLDFTENQGVHRQVFATKAEATKYANNLKASLLALVKEKQAEYADKRREGVDSEQLKVSPTKLITNSNAVIFVTSFVLNGKEEIASALCVTPPYKYYSYDNEWGMLMGFHPDCAVFFFDSVESDTRHNQAIGDPSYTE